MELNYYLSQVGYIMDKSPIEIHKQSIFIYNFLELFKNCINSIIQILLKLIINIYVIIISYFTICHLYNDDIFENNKDTFSSFFKRRNIFILKFFCYNNSIDIFKFILNYFLKYIYRKKLTNREYDNFSIVSGIINNIFFNFILIDLSYTFILKIINRDSNISSIYRLCFYYRIISFNNFRNKKNYLMKFFFFLFNDYSNHITDLNKE